MPTESAKSYYIVDERERTDPDGGTIFECCDTLAEARRNLKHWPRGSVIIDEQGEIIE